MSDHDPALVETLAEIAWEILDTDGHNGIECRPERPMDYTCEAVIRAVLATLDEAWPCANYQAPATCLTAPSSESGRCDWCKGVADQIRAQALDDAADDWPRYMTRGEAQALLQGRATRYRNRADRVEGNA